MTDIHAQQFQTIQQVAATIDALTQRLSDLRQLADFMSKSEAMAAELAAHRQVAELAPEQPRLSDLIKRQPQTVGELPNTLASAIEATVSDETIRRVRKTGSDR